jgi:tRNA-dihydrouridine synthase B
MHIGPHEIKNRVIVAPMAGVTDRTFRRLCKRLGAGMAVSEMTSSRPELRSSRKSRRRADHDGEPAPISVQIAGADPHMMADAARYNVDHGAQIIDINMGCPAKKVCNVMAGSALLRDEPLVARILDAVVRAVDVPVTLKIRTGWDRSNRNAVQVAQLAQSAGICALAVHGRTRACGFGGEAEYDTIAEVKARSRIPIIANGDIAGPEEAQRVLARTRADAVMIGRAAQGRPWIFREINHFLETGRHLAAPAPAEVHRILREHLLELHDFYGEECGVRVARKHLGWYLRTLDAACPLAGGDRFRSEFNRLTTSAAQIAEVDRYFESIASLAPWQRALEEELAA